jgi:hypothetical protein
MRAHPVGDDTNVSAIKPLSGSRSKPHEKRVLISGPPQSHVGLRHLDEAFFPLAGLAHEDGVEGGKWGKEERTFIVAKESTLHK